MCFYQSKKGNKNLVLVFDYFEHDLYGLISKKIQFNENQLKLIFWQLSQGIRDLHEKKIFHRDIKSSNILFTNEGRVIIADLGLSLKLAKKSTKLHRVCSTPLYRSPEQLL